MICLPGNGQNITALNARGPEPTQKQPGISGHVGLFSIVSQKLEESMVEWSTGKRG